MGQPERGSGVYGLLESPLLHEHDSLSLGPNPPRVEAEPNNKLSEYQASENSGTIAAGKADRTVPDDQIRSAVN